DGNHNLSALCEDIEDKLIGSEDDINDYLLYHPTYTNMKILPGAILKYESPSEDTLILAFNAILSYARSEGFTSVIFDTDAGLNSKSQLEMLKKVDKIVMPLIERPGTIVNLQKVFDAEFGPFYLNF